MAEELTERLSDDEMRQLIKLLVRYCNSDLDQFDDWRVTLPWGEAYISISNALPPGVPRDAFTEVWPFSPKLRESNG
ncbi:hypothetical protein [Catenulispora yoronensis]